MRASWHFIMGKLVKSVELCLALNQFFQDACIMLVLCLICYYRNSFTAQLNVCLVTGVTNDLAGNVSQWKVILLLTVAWKERRVKVLSCSALEKATDEQVVEQEQHTIGLVDLHLIQARSGMRSSSAFMITPIIVSICLPIRLKCELALNFFRVPRSTVALFRYITSVTWVMSCVLPNLHTYRSSHLMSCLAAASEWV